MVYTSEPFDRNTSGVAARVPALCVSRRRVVRETPVVGKRRNREAGMETTIRDATDLGPVEGRAMSIFGEALTRKVAAEQTGGAYSLFEASSRPGGGPPPHVQHREDECLYVLEGEFEILMGDEVARAGAGSSFYVPKGCLHSYRNAGSRTGRLLLIHTPGGPHEEFVDGVGDDMREGEISALAASYGIEIASTFRT